MFRCQTVAASEFPELAGDRAPPGWLAESEATLLANMRFPTRRRKWLLGRIAAKRLLSEVLATSAAAPRPTAIVIANESSGAPYALVSGSRLPLMLSISHRANFGFAAVADSTAIAVGADLEMVTARDPGLIEDFFTAGEARRCAAASGRDAELLIARTWSAKEAVLKALRIGLRRDTRTIAVGADSTVAAPPGWRALAVSLAPSTADDYVGPMPVLWRDHGDYVLTMACAPVADALLQSGLH